MATVSNLIMEGNSTVDETFDNADWLAWFNGALGELSLALNLEGKADVTIDYDPYDPTILHRDFPLPADCIMLSAILDSNGQMLRLTTIDKAKEGSKIYEYGGRIYFSEDYPIGSTFSLLYTRRPAQLKNDSDVPEVPEEFQQLLVIYGCYKSQLKDDELERAQMFYMEYLTQKNNFETHMKRTRPKKSMGYGSSWQVIR